MTLQGEQVRVHFNLRTRRWSVSTKIKGKGWRVAGHYDAIRLTDAVPIVSKKGVDRIRAKGQREVIAKIEGTFAEGWDAQKGCAFYELPQGEKVRFNPHKRYDFFKDSGATWSKSSEVFFPTGVGYFLEVA